MNNRDYISDYNEENEDESSTNGSFMGSSMIFMNFMIRSSQCGQMGGSCLSDFTTNLGHSCKQSRVLRCP
jgi:hypothetical protein